MDVICLGIVVADIFAAPLDCLPAAGELKVIDRFLSSVGGCAANTAACLRRLGRTVKVIGKTGNDLFGEFVMRDLERLGVDASGIKKSSTFGTSTTVILPVRNEDRRYVHCLGANADFRLADVELAALEGARALYVGGYLAMPGFTASEMALLFREARRRGLKTVLDVVIPAGKPVSMDQVEPFLPYTDVFLPNNEEARTLTGQDDPVKQAEFFARVNPQCTIVITQGRKGALATRGGRMISAGVFEVESVDESGAGDAFSAGFLVGVLENWSLETTLSFASAMGASCTRALGCLEGVFYMDEALSFVSTHPLEIKKVGPS